MEIGKEIKFKRIEEDAKAEKVYEYVYGFFSQFIQQRREECKVV